MFHHMVDVLSQSTMVTMLRSRGVSDGASAEYAEISVGEGGDMSHRPDEVTPVRLPPMSTYLI